MQTRALLNLAKQLPFKGLIDNRCHALEAVPEPRAIHKLNANFFLHKIKSECKYLRIDCYFRAHMEYKRPDGGLKIPWSALALFGKFSNQRLGVYTPYAHKNSNQSLYLHFLHHFLLIKNNILIICNGYMAFQKGTTRGINPASGTANTRPCNETIGFEQCHLWNLFLAVWQQ